MAKVRFLPDGLEIEVDAGTTLLEAAQEMHAQVGSACGGKCACSTCHLYVVSGGQALTAKEEDEEDRLDMAFDVRAHSRLGCQASVTDGDAVVVCEITRESRQAWLDEHPEARRKESPGVDRSTS